MQALTSLLAKLVACPSVTPDDAGCQKILLEYLEPLGFNCKTLVYADVTNMWAKYGDAKPLIVFAGHTDVVPPGPETAWDSNPFKLTERNGDLYGRGTADMKGALACMVLAAQKFIQTHPQFSGSIGFLITSDEEGPGVNGTKRVVAQLTAEGESIDYCIIGEPSSIDKVGDQIRIGRRGSLHGRLRVQGKQGHVAHPHLAENPIHKSALALHNLSTTRWDEGNEDFPATTFQITNIHSGTGAANVIPGYLESLFNFRFSTAISIEELKLRTKAIFNEAKLNFEIAWSIGGEPFLTKKGRLLEVVQHAIQDVTGLTTLQSTGGGTSDGRFIAPTGAEIVELGTSHATAHHINEHVKSEDLTMLYEIYYQILLRLLK